MGLGMKESYREDLASYSGLEPYAGDGNIARTVRGKVRADTAESKNLCMRRHPKRENREILLVSTSCVVA